MVRRLAGRLMLDREIHSLKAYVPISETVFDNVTVVRDLHPLNIRPPTKYVLILADVIEIQLSKA